jgi:hypothetical protein
MDLVIGATGEDVDGVLDAGAVQVIYGAAAGLTSAGNQLWHQNISGIMDASETYDQFGDALATGDFNNDGARDLAIGVPGEAVGTKSSAGAVQVIYGIPGSPSNPGSLTTSGNQLWYQDSSGVGGSSEPGDEFGKQLGAGDFNHDYKWDLAISVPGEDWGSIENSGGVHVLYGAGGGLTSAGTQLWSQDATDIEGAAATGDRFGGW